MSDKTGYVPEPDGFATTAIHDFQDPEQWDSLSVVTPLVLSASFKQYGPGDFKKYRYGRCEHPNREVLENCLASLENGKHGLCWSSGMAAISAVSDLLQSGDHILCEDDIYETTGRLFRTVCGKSGITVSFANENDFESAIKPNTKILWIESLSNPTMKHLDVKAIADLAHKNNVLLVVDNTFMSPYFYRPLDYGADIVVHSITKYINGHDDVIMGVTLTNNKQIYDRLRTIQEVRGGVPSPFDCYLANRSLKTLALRMNQHGKNSLEVAKFLETHPKIEKVLHPGLPSHPQHELFKKQASGFSGMIGFYLKNAGFEKSQKFLTSLKVITLATSLGSYNSLAELPSRMSHFQVPDELKAKLKITDNFIRMSVGLEDIGDLISDLKQALDKF